LEFTLAMSCRFADRYGRKTRLVVEGALHPRPQAMLFPLPDSGSGPGNVMCLPNDAQRQMLEEAPCSLQRNGSCGSPRPRVASSSRSTPD